jgi:hypothetical protein
VQGRVRARQGDYVLAVANGYNWKAGRVYQWTGTAWEYREPGNYSDLYTRCFKDGLEVPELTQDMGWFGAVFAKLLIAERAFIETLGAQVIELLDGGQIKSRNFVSGQSGFQIKANGDAEFNKMLVRDSTILESEIFAGPLYLSKEKPTPITRTFSPGTTSTQIGNVTGSYRGVIGQYNNIDIKAIRIDSQTTNYTGTNIIMWQITRTTASAIYIDGREILLADQIYEVKHEVDYIIVGEFPNIQYIPNQKSSFNTINLLTLQNYLWFTFIMSGMTMKLLNIPDSQPVESGTVWRSGNGLMIA